MIEDLEYIVHNKDIIFSNIYYLEYSRNWNRDINNYFLKFLRNQIQQVFGYTSIKKAPNEVEA